MDFRGQPHASLTLSPEINKNKQAISDKEFEYNSRGIKVEFRECSES
jgi:hypothetical protein